MYTVFGFTFMIKTNELFELDKSISNYISRDIQDQLLFLSQQKEYDKGAEIWDYVP
jgi:hypothetical protein